MGKQWNSLKINTQNVLRTYSVIHFTGFHWRHLLSKDDPAGLLNGHGYSLMVPWEKEHWREVLAPQDFKEPVTWFMMKEWELGCEHQNIPACPWGSRHLAMFSVMKLAWVHGLISPYVLPHPDQYEVQENFQEIWKLYRANVNQVLKVPRNCNLVQIHTTPYIWVVSK